MMFRSIENIASNMTPPALNSGKITGTYEPK
jgi:hypothetical protein